MKDSEPENYTLLEEKRESKKCKNTKYCYMILPFLLITILVYAFYPKKPEVILKKVYLSYNNTGVTGEFKFKNSNIYSVEWNHLNVDLYWIPYSYDVVGPICINSNNMCDYYYDDMCSIKLANFKLDSKFTTGPVSYIKKQTQGVSTKNELACIIWMINNYHDKRFLLTSGKVHSKSDLKNFGSLKIKDVVYYLNLK